MHPNEIALNDYVDGALPPNERASVEQHVQDCVDCRRLVEQVRGIKQAAAQLPPLPPPERTWARIRDDVARSFEASSSRDDVARSLQASASRDAARSAKAFALPKVFALPKAFTLRSGWLAAAAAVVLAVALSWYFVARSGRPSPSGSVPTTATTAAPDAQAVEAELRQAEEHYQKAINGLEQIAAAGKGSLDPATAATLEKNLSVVDQAIGESRAALRQQPTSEPAQQSLLENFRTKLALLEDTVALINEMRKGNETGAARIASGLKQKG